MKYLKHTGWNYSRQQTTPVKAGNITIGGNADVVVQSMANTQTHNVEASIAQAKEIFDAGAQMVRFTVVNSKDADALRNIKAGLTRDGYHLPLVADVHFNPHLADIAAQYVDKVRINPGNYLDKRATFEHFTYTNEEYQQELIRLEERFCSFLDICRQHNTAIRIGTNHGSLSDRIMSRFGDSPAGMVEATMEFLRICKKYHFNNVVISLKSSNTRVMIEAYRRMVVALYEEDMHFPLHLGVTEAGNGEDGRIKSAVGIGALMNDGIGDTIRVSLTENPAKEIPVAKQLCAHFNRLNQTEALSGYLPNSGFSAEFSPRKTTSVSRVGGEQLPVVVADLSAVADIDSDVLQELGFTLDSNQRAVPGLQSPDVLFIGEQQLMAEIDPNVIVITDCNYWQPYMNTYPLFSWGEYLVAENRSTKMNWVQMSREHLDVEAIQILKTDSTIVVVLFSSHQNPVLDQRAFINALQESGCENPVIIFRDYKSFSYEEFQLTSAADNGIFFTDGMANGLWIRNAFKSNEAEAPRTAFGILQASRARFTKVEYISCPSCGRTLFDLEATLKQVQEATASLNGLKIAVMGCIVNGPGEMADADFGYVGSGPGKVTLYKGKEVIKRNIPAETAVQELLTIIEKNK